ncbi:MAG TPA: hypothetical protein VMX36_01815 [Sedimentisphaerales bacterium]|nr:hypothetical protein [Sedimentisphaerales bacterium]
MTTTKDGVSSVGYDISELSSSIVEVWFRDDAGFGRQGMIDLIWSKTGIRPGAFRQTKYERL